MSTLDFSKHPCFNPDAKGKFGRVHLPVAPKCNIQCKYCNRKYDCVNESRPGVTSNILSPGQALHYVGRLKEMKKPISVCGIAGPGDPMANAEETLETMALIRKKHPDMLLCLSSNGLGIPAHAKKIAEIGVSHVTITMNAIDTKIGAQIYSWVRDGKKVYRGEEAAKVLMDRQIEAIKKLKALGVVVKVNSILIPGVNDHHVAEVAAFVGELGADLHNIIPLMPVEGTDFADCPEPTAEQIAEARAACGEHVPQMTHCQRCRADACGLLCEGTTQDTLDLLQEAASKPINPSDDRPYVAAASREGVLVNMHLGEADELVIFKAGEDSFDVVDARKTPPKGCGDDRWDQLAELTKDCRAILVSGAGPRPTEVLQASGVRVIVMEGLISEALESIYAGEEVIAPVRKFKCGDACMGDGSGCG
jgi:nitrogen fixation protein NifB